MDVLFINSVNFSRTKKSLPLGILSLASVLKRNNYDVDAIDFDLLFYKGTLKLEKNLDSMLDKMINIINSNSPRLVVFYTMCNSYPFTINLAMTLRNSNPEIGIIFGGPHATITAQKSLEMFPFIDCIGIGEGEETIVPIIDAILNKRDYSNLKGIAYRANGIVHINNGHELMSNLDLLPPIDDNYLSPYLSDEGSKTKIIADIEAGRGCPYSCTYCSTSLFWNRKFRLKSIYTIISEMLELNRKYNVNHFILVHDLFTAKKETVKEFCQEIIKLNMGFTWECSVRMDTIDRELIHLMDKANCTKIFTGIETGSARMQSIIKKNLRLEQVTEKIELLKGTKIKITTSFIYGFPEEVEQDLKNTLDLISQMFKLGVDHVILYRYFVLPGTNEYEKVKDILYLDVNNMERGAIEIPYLSDVVDIVRTSSDIFSNFYEFNTSVRTNMYGLDIFINFLNTGFWKFPRTFNKILDLFNEDIFELFCSNRRLIDELKEDIYKCQHKKEAIIGSILKEYLRYIDRFIIELSSTHKSEALLEEYMLESSLY